MTCEEAQALLLEAETEELAMTASSPLVTHLRSCGECRQVAGQLAAAHEPLRITYLAVKSRHTAADTAMRAMTALPPRRAEARIPRWSLLPVGLAAAAVLAISMFTTRPPRSDGTRETRMVSDTTLPVVAIEVPPGRNAIVFATKNPDISVVWLY